jgi:hypothetical protein
MGGTARCLPTKDPIPKRYMGTDIRLLCEWWRYPIGVKMKKTLVLIQKVVEVFGRDDGELDELIDTLHDEYEKGWCLTVLECNDMYYHGGDEGAIH